MYKYLRYVGVLLWTLFRKVFGLFWYYLAVPFRRYANNVVFNYVLDNNLHLPRLLEKDISSNESYYNIAPSHGTSGGYIERRPISKLEYYLVYWFIWGWLDADSYCDTTSETFLKEWSDGTRGTRGTRDNSECLSKCNGNSFDKGDAVEDNFCFLMSSLWNIRNTAYNFRYMQFELRDESLVFQHTIESRGWRFGWFPREGSKAEYINGKLNYNLCFMGWD